MGVINSIRSLFWTIYLRGRGAQVGKNFQVLAAPDILLRDNASWKNIVIGNNVIFGGKVYIRIRKNGKIILGNGVRTGTEVWLVGANDYEFISRENTVLGSDNICNGGHGLKIGAHCIFSGFVYINTSDHNFRRKNLIQKQGFFGAPVVIGEDVWLGEHVFVSKGVNIGKGAVIGAGAIVIGVIPEYKIAVGNPARVLRDRD